MITRIAASSSLGPDTSTVYIRRYRHRGYTRTDTWFLLLIPFLSYNSNKINASDVDTTVCIYHGDPKWAWCWCGETVEAPPRRRGVSTVDCVKPVSSPSCGQLHIISIYCYPHICRHTHCLVTPSNGSKWHLYHMVFLNKSDYLCISYGRYLT